MQKTHVTFYPKQIEPVTIECEIAKTLSEKMKGLMNRDHLPQNNGMLFQFAYPNIRFFWMKNVKIPLDIIFVNRKMEIIKIYEAPIETGFFYKQYWSHGFCRYIIECNMGFCKKNNIQKDTKIMIKN